MNNINESTLSRVWQHINSERPIALLTAFRGEFSYDDNVQRNKTLAANIRSKGYGFFYMDGYWIENQGTEDEVHVSEDSIFVIGSPGDDQAFLSQMIDYCQQWNQDAVLVKTQQGTKLYQKDGAVMFDVGEFKPGKAGEIYTKLRNNKKANTFVFESERDDQGWLARMKVLAGTK